MYLLKGTFGGHPAPELLSIPAIDGDGKQPVLFEGSEEETVTSENGRGKTGGDRSFPCQFGRIDLDGRFTILRDPGTTWAAKLVPVRCRGGSDGWVRTKQEAESGREKYTFHDSRDAGEHDPTIVEGRFQS